MKMGATFFWGLIFILIGVGLIIKVIFNIDFPVVKFVIAFILIIIGIKVLMGNLGSPRNEHTCLHDVVFRDAHINGADNEEYNVVFGKGVFNLTDTVINGSPVHIKINTVFGGTIIRVRKDTPVEVRIDAVFAGAQLPNGNSSVFGTTIYQSPGLDKTKNYLQVEANIVFGGCEVITE
jgi:hypothetical protein